jgi:hypothetical protein
MDRYFKYLRRNGQMMTLRQLHEIYTKLKKLYSGTLPNLVTAMAKYCIRRKWYMYDNNNVRINEQFQIRMIFAVIGNDVYAFCKRS